MPHRSLIPREVLQKFIRTLWRSTLMYAFPFLLARFSRRAVAVQCARELSKKEKEKKKKRPNLPRKIIISVYFARRKECFPPSSRSSSFTRRFSSALLPCALFGRRGYDVVGLFMKFLECLCRGLRAKKVFRPISYSQITETPPT